MKQRILLVMAAALFSWVGFAQSPINLFDKLANGEYRQENPSDQIYQDGSDWVIQFNADYKEVVIEFEEGEIVGKYNKVVVEYEPLGATDGTATLGIWIDNEESGVWTNQNDGVVDTYYLLGPSEIYGIGLFGTWNWVYPQELRIKKLELVYDPNIPFPDYFTNPIDFQNSQLRQDYFFAKGVDSDAPFGILTTNRNWLSTNDWEAVFEKEGTNVFLAVNQSRGENIPTFLMRLPAGKKFGDVEEISFKYRIPDYADYAVITVNSIGGNAYVDGAQADLGHCPAVFYSMDGAIDDGYAGWATFTMKTAWFDPAGEGSDFNNDRWSIADGYAPNLASIAGLDVIWLGVGLSTWSDYHMDDITLKFADCVQGVNCYCDLNPGVPGCEEIIPSVQTVKASSLIVYSIPGGLAIQGAEAAAIYGIDGSLIATAKGSIALPKGIYIVKAGDEVVKAIVK